MGVPSRIWRRNTISTVAGIDVYKRQMADSQAMYFVLGGEEYYMKDSLALREIDPETAEMQVILDEMPGIMRGLYVQEPVYCLLYTSRSTWSSRVLFSTVMSPKLASWKVVEPSRGIRWRITKGSPASTRA